MPERQEHFPALAFHGRGRRSLLPLLDVRVICRRYQQTTSELEGGQRDLLRRPSVSGMKQRAYRDVFIASRRSWPFGRVVCRNQMMHRLNSIGVIRVADGANRRCRSNKEDKGICSADHHMTGPTKAPAMLALPPSMAVGCHVLSVTWMCLSESAERALWPMCNPRLKTEVTRLSIQAEPTPCDPARCCLHIRYGTGRGAAVPVLPDRRSPRCRQVARAASD